MSPSSQDVRSTYFSRLRLQLDESITSLLNPRKLSVSNDFFRIDSVAIDPDQLPSSPVLRTIPEIDTRTNDDNGRENAYVLTSGGGKTSLAKSVFNLANTTVGAGTLALPFFFSQCGWLLGLVILVLVAGLSDLSLHLLVDCGLFSEKRTYLNVARHAKGGAGARLVECTLLLLTFGAMTSYLVIIGDVAHQTIEVLSTANTQISRALLSGCAIMLVAPLLFLKNLSSLAPASILALAAVTWLVAIVVYDSADFLIETLPSSASKRSLARIGGKFFFAVPTIALAYTNHTNLYEIIAEMERPTRKRISIMIHSTTAACTLIYALVGMMGYLRFGGDTQDDIILNYSQNSPGEHDTSNVSMNRKRFMASGSIGIIICMVMSFPLLLFPCRNCFHILLRNALQRCPQCVRHLNPNVYFVLETVFLVATSFGLSMVIPNLATCLGLTGALTGSLLVYILPAWFFLCLMKKQEASIFFPEGMGLGKSLGAYTLLLLGFLVLVLGSGSIIYQSIV